MHPKHEFWAIATDPEANWSQRDHYCAYAQRVALHLIRGADDNEDGLFAKRNPADRDQAAVTFKSSPQVIVRATLFAMFPFVTQLDKSWRNVRQNPKGKTANETLQPILTETSSVQTIPDELLGEGKRT